MYEADWTVCCLYIGFRPKYMLDRPCRSCASRIAKLGKPSPKKGIKTGKPAWNRGQFFDNPLKKIVRNRVSRRMRHALSGRNLSKNWEHVFIAVGYSIDDLMKDLESKFESGMSWDNIGQWHIDHIIPDSWFNYSSTSDEQFKQCWSLNNLQPLWRLENISKNNRYSGKPKGGG
jgi:RNase P protein component